jgi:hypothetical protein
MMDRRQFLNAAIAIAATPGEWVEVSAGQGSRRHNISLAAVETPNRALFPVTMQLSPLPGSAGSAGASTPAARQALRATIDQLVRHGFRGLEYPFGLTAELDGYVLEYAKSRGMFLTYNYTFAKGGVENFDRTKQPAVSVYSPEYEAAIRKNLAPVLEEVKRLGGVDSLFCYQDEPFHASPACFDLSEAAKGKFQKRFGYRMPLDLAALRDSPKEWLDLINFQSSSFADGWRQVYRAIKESDPQVKVILTHDSHSAFGAGVGSDSKTAVDDVFHWGADFADIFVFDIYPYMMFDYRYGEMGKFRVPRLSQMHFALAQLRNLTSANEKTMGFWFGTYNRKWFKDFMGPELKAQKWAEAEITYTAVGHGADFLISGYKAPEDEGHWSLLGKALEVLQEAGDDLLACPRVKAKACFLFPRTQYVQLQEEYWNVGIAYELFQQAFGEIDCLHEEQVTDATLGGYKVLVLFDVQLLPDEVALRIAEFVHAGGVVIADCVPQFDANRKPSDVLDHVFGVREAQVGRIKRSGVWIPSLTHPHWATHSLPGADEDAVVGELVAGTVFEKTALEQAVFFRAISPRPSNVTTGDILLKGTNGTPALIRQKSGRGQAYLFGFCMQDTYFEAWKDQDDASRAALLGMMRSVVRAAGVVANVSSSNPEVEVCLRANSGNGYVIAINHEAEDPKTKVCIRDIGFRVARVDNLTDKLNMKFEAADGGITFDLQAPREHPQLIRLSSQQAIHGAAKW